MRLPSILLVAAVLVMVPFAVTPTSAVVPAVCPDVQAPGCLPFERVAHGLGWAPWGTFVFESEAACEASGFPMDCSAVDYSTHWVAAVTVHRSNCCAELWIRDVVFRDAGYVVTWDISPFGFLAAFSDPHDAVAIERQSELPVVAVFVGPPLDPLPTHL